MLKFILPVLIVFVAFNAHAGRWGNEPHHDQMQRNHDEIREYINHADERLVACARTASKQLNDNDWHAAQGYGNTTAWAQRREIMRQFSGCVIAITQEHLSDNPRRGQYGSEDHHQVMQRAHNQVRKYLNSFPGARACAETASAGLNATDAEASVGWDANPEIWAERDQIMIQFNRCISWAQQLHNREQQQAAYDRQQEQRRRDAQRAREQQAHEDSKACDAEPTRATGYACCERTFGGGVNELAYASCRQRQYYKQ